MTGTKEPRLRFAQGAQKEKSKKLTQVYVVFSGDMALGIVKWWAHWRRYCFFPYINTLLDAGCLIDIADFCTRVTADQKADQARRRAAQKATP
jgi:hypothetical protein